MFMMIFVMLSISMASVERINEVLNDQNDDWLSRKWGSKEVADGSINFEDVTFAYTDENGHDKTHVFTRDYPFYSFREVIWEEQDQENQAWCSWFFSMMSSLVGWHVAGHDVKKYDLDPCKQVAMVLRPMSFSLVRLKGYALGK